METRAQEVEQDQARGSEKKDLETRLSTQFKTMSQRKEKIKIDEVISVAEQEFELLPQTDAALIVKSANPEKRLVLNQNRGDEKFDDMILQPAYHLKYQTANPAGQ